MKMGITFDLRSTYLAQGYGTEETAEFDEVVTIDAIDAALQKLGFTTDRIGNVYELIPRLHAGDRWDLVFNIAEGLYGAARESLVPALLDAYQIPYTFSDPVVLAVTLDKSIAKRILQTESIPTANFFVIHQETDIVNCHLSFPVFVKPIAGGTGQGVTVNSCVHSKVELQQQALLLLRQFQQAVLVETYLPGREFTVGVIGNGSSATTIGVMEILLTNKAEQPVYSYINKADFAKRVTYRLAQDEEAQRAGEVALAAWRALQCRDGGRVDIRSDINGQPHFLEVNPLAGLRPHHSDLAIAAELNGISYQLLIARIMSATLQRLGLAMPTALNELMYS